MRIEFYRRCYARRRVRYAAPRRPARPSVHVYGPSPKKGHARIVRFVNANGSWHRTHTAEHPYEMLKSLPGAISVHEANKLGVAHGNPVTPENEHLLTPMAEEVRDEPQVPPTPTPPRLADAPRRPVQLPNRSRPKSILEEEDRLPY